MSRGTPDRKTLEGPEEIVSGLSLPVPDPLPYLLQERMNHPFVTTTFLDPDTPKSLS